MKFAIVQLLAALCAAEKSVYAGEGGDHDHEHGVDDHDDDHHDGFIEIPSIHHQHQHPRRLSGGIADISAYGYRTVPTVVVQPKNPHKNGLISIDNKDDHDDHHEEYHHQEDHYDDGYDIGNAYGSGFVEGK